MATLETLLSQQMVERLGWTLIHFVWQAATVALLLAAGAVRMCDTSLRVWRWC